MKGPVTGCHDFFRAPLPEHLVQGGTYVFTQTQSVGFEILTVTGISYAGERILLR